jgi:hypothetical protein
MQPYPFKSHLLRDLTFGYDIDVRFEIADDPADVQVLANWSNPPNCPKCPSPSQNDSAEYAKLALANWTTYVTFNRCAYSKQDLLNRCLVNPHDDFRILVAARSAAHADKILGFALLRRSFAKSLQLEYLGVSPFMLGRIKGLGTALFYKSLVMARHLGTEVYYFEETVLSAPFYDRYRPTVAFHLGGLNAFSKRDYTLTEKFLAKTYPNSEIEV